MKVERQRCAKRRLLWGVIGFLAVFLGSLVAVRKEVKAADPLLAYKDEAIYRVGNTLRDKDMRYIIRLGSGMSFRATQSAYSTISGVDWQVDSVGNQGMIEFVGGKPKVEDCVVGVYVRGRRPGTLVLDGRVLSASLYDVQWVSNKFPIRVVQPLTAFTLTRESVSLSPGDTVQLDMETMTPDSLYSLVVTIWGSPLTYISSDPSVAAVDENGKVTAVGSGTATVTASTQDGVTAACVVSVKGAASGSGNTDGGGTGSAGNTVSGGTGSTGSTDASSSESGASAKGMSLNKTKMTLQIGKKGTLTARQNGKKVKASYSGGKGIVTIDKNGNVTAKKAGTVAIKVTYKKESKTCQITVIPATMSLKAAVSGKNVTLSWKKASGVTGYEIYRASSKNGKYKKIKTIKASSKKLVLKKQKKGTYYYKIRGYKKKGGKIYEGSLSKLVKVKIK